MDSTELAFEQDLQRGASFSNWWFYIDYKAGAVREGKASASNLYVLYERALEQLPNSYKLWYAYLKRRVADTHGKCINDRVFTVANACFDRALTHMYKMPRIWVMYIELLIRQKFITRVRKTFDDALKNLAITLHQQWIWGRYIKWSERCGVRRTAVVVYKRFLKVNPGKTEDFITVLAESGAVEEAALELTRFLDNPALSSSSGKSRYDLWKQLVTLCTENPTKVRHLDVEAVIRSGIKRFASEVGNLYNALAVYYVKQGVFGKARDVFEDGIAAASTVRDFSVIFDAYSLFEENVLTARMEAFDALQSSKDVDSSEVGYERDLQALQMEVDLRMARLELLMDRRPLLLNSVLLKQNPHNCKEWLNRAELVKDDPVKVIQTYSEAVTTVDARYVCECVSMCMCACM
jgi:pre-mRNA-splicing factor SYF1